MEILEAKSYLAKIRMKNYKLEELRYEMYLEENGLNSLKVQDLSKTRVSGTKENDLSNVPIHVAAYQKQIMLEVEEINEMKKEGKAFIKRIPDDLRQSVLRYYYIDFLDWPQVAALMNFSEAHIFRLRRSGILYLNRSIRLDKIKMVQSCIHQIIDKRIVNDS